jgi:hypothetical protein
VLAVAVLLLTVRRVVAAVRVVCVVLQVELVVIQQVSLD